ncbi:DUF6777 domain-containing protein [Streptomyces sp. NPDC002888]|uniref:DUF6777 domain-containing protein n=1 Tax=Streptomyces sp. NPDC002888 TaxID=3364668 RepID=UPI00367E69C8
MNIRAFMRGAGIRVVRRIAVLLVLVLVTSGCDRDAPLLVVRAVAVGVPSLAPFFDESQGLGHDAEIRSLAAPGSLQQGDTPGLYGGTKQPGICDVEQLKEFLADPRNDRKAQVWAGVFGITTEEIPGFLDRLTPVLLRHDTLVKNHDYKKEKAVPFDSLLQAGIAVLVDEQGVPAVKCSCGNPLRPFTGDADRIDVKFQHGNKAWKGYDRSSVVAVRPASRQLERLALVDVDEPQRGIDRPIGTTGEKDTTFNTRKVRTVPSLTGTTFGEASRKLADNGLGASYDGEGLPPDDARVTASDPPAGTELRFGEYVVLRVAGGSGRASTPPGPGGSESTHTPPTSSDPPTSSGPPASSDPPSSSTPPSSSSAPPSSSPPPSSDPPPSSPPPSSDDPPSPEPPTSAPPTTTSAPPEITSGPPESISAPPTTAPEAPPEPPKPPTTAPEAPPEPPEPPEPPTTAPEIPPEPPTTDPATSAQA